MNAQQKKNEEIRVENRLKVHRTRRERLPQTLDGLVNMFSRIYRGAHYDIPLEVIALHFLEEVGEVAAAIRDLRETEDQSKL